MDAVRSIVAEEGVAGLYKGFGALLLQYGVHVAILKLAKWLFERMAADAATPAAVTPLCDLQRMQQVQAQVRGQQKSRVVSGGGTRTRRISQDEAAWYEQRAGISGTF